tara:strand:- start:805 stop:1521 length:717 start_codon:yes stop_codon:yes gene_type:complete
MCIAINSPKGTTPTTEAMKKSFEANPHGAGFVFAHDNKLKIEKGFMSFGKFLNAYNKAHFGQLKNLNKLIHFRIKTSGKIDYDNCHPFKITDEVAVIHNGIIPNFGNGNVSDTRQFIELVLRPIIKEHGTQVLTNQTFVQSMEDLIGNSKLAFLDNKGNSYIINETLGHYNCDVWYSNDSYKSYGAYSSYSVIDKPLDGFCDECGMILDRDEEYSICEFCDEDIARFKSSNRYYFNRY